MVNPSKNLFLTLDFEEDLGSANPGKTFFCHRKSDKLIDFVLDNKLRVTLFITGEILAKYPELLSPYLEYSNHFEYELHAYDHSTIFMDIPTRKLNILQGINAYRDFFGRNPKLYRAPNGMISSEEVDLLIEEGLYAGSNFFPAFFPGRFNNLSIPKNPFYIKDSSYFEVPVSVTKYIPIPFSLSYVKLVGWNLYKQLLNFNSSLLVFDFHLHDLFPDEYSGKIKLSTVHKLAYGVNGSNKKSFTVFRQLISDLLDRNFRSDFLSDLSVDQVTQRVHLSQ